MSRFATPALAVLAGCAAVDGPPPPALLARLAQPAAPAARVSAGTLELDGAGLRGTFEARVAVRARGGARDVRLQLFPDIGGKLLDVVATPAAIHGRFPQAGRAVDHDAGAATPPSLLLLVGLTLLELETPITAVRVLGARSRGDGWDVRLEPAMPGLSVRAWLDAAGDPVQHALGWRGAHWLVDHAARTIRGPGFVARFDVRETVERALPDAAFQLEPAAEGQR